MRHVLGCWFGMFFVSGCIWAGVGLVLLFSNPLLGLISIVSSAVIGGLGFLAMKFIAEAEWEWLD